MNKKIYNEVVTAEGGLDPILKKCLLSQLAIYNHALEVLRSSPYMSYDDMMLKHVYPFIEQNKLEHVILRAVHNEIYYLHKKFRRGRVFEQKRLSSIQYLTLLVNNYHNNDIQVDKTGTRLSLQGKEGYLQLPAALPAIPSTGVLLYLNLSYSAMNDQFQLSIFEQTTGSCVPQSLPTLKAA